MLKFVKKFTIIIALIFTITIVKAEPGVIEFVFRSSGDCSYKTEQISVKGETYGLTSVTLVNQYGKKVLNKRISFKSSTIQLDVPCGFYNLTVVDLKTGIAKSYPVQLR